MVNGQGNGHQYYLLDPYRDFLETEGVPIHEGYAVDCHTLPVEPWERLGGKGAYIHLAGRGDFLSSYLAEIPPGGQLNMERHLHEETIYVISGHARFWAGPDLSDPHDAEAGDFVWVPPHEVHAETNRSDTEPVRMAVARSTQEAIVVNLPNPEGWPPQEGAPGAT